MDGDRVKAYPYFAEGLRAHELHRATVAIALYRRALELDPAFFEAQFNLGLVALDSGDSKRALESFESALAIRPDATEARYNFAMSLRNAGYPPDAAQQLETLLTTQKNETKAHFALAKLYADDLGRIDLAREHYRKVIELEPRHPQGLDIRQWLAQHAE